MSKNDTVGPGRPPRHSRYRPGQSGNPRGRPKGRLNLNTVINRALRKTITITERGRARRLTKLEAIITALVHHGLKGDHKSTELLLRIAAAAEIDVSDKTSFTDVPPPSKDSLRRIYQRLARIIDEEQDQ